jgi:1-acyl-sn-glycerol-3-phosphate acyltransferase
MRTAFVGVMLWVLTVPLSAIVVVASLLGVADRPGGVYDWATHTWARGLLWAAGVRVQIEGKERLAASLSSPCVFVSNHVSWFDVFLLAAIIPRYSFIAKREILSVPIFGPAARACGTVPIDRNNRKSAFSSYQEAAEFIQGGRSVIVFPEGTRGKSPELRPFKKGPFVMAIAAGVPIVPTVIQGTLAIMPRWSWRVRGGCSVSVRFLEPIATAGMTYEDRDRLSDAVHERMEGALPGSAGGVGAVPAAPTSAAR